MKNIFIALLLAIIGVQLFFINKFYKKSKTAVTEINLVQVAQKQDSLDLFTLKSGLESVEASVQNIQSILGVKKFCKDAIAKLDVQQLSSAVYLTTQSTRYSKFLAELEQQIQMTPLGMPSDGYISSNFGYRINPIPPTKKPLNKDSLMKIARAEAIKKVDTITTKDSAGNIKTITVPSKIVVEFPKPKKIKVGNKMVDEELAQFHKGLDIALNFGSDVYCTAQGKVVFAGEKSGYGHCVIVQHAGNLATLYGHLSQVLVKAGEDVQVGKVIAKSGNSGRSTGPHLHYEVHKNGTPVNPKLFLGM